jgi:F0F1-type ATP synthase assembly protein I
MKRHDDASGPSGGLLQGQVAFSLALGLALDLAVCIALGFWADRRFGTRPWFTLLGIALGLGTSVATVYAVTRSAARRRDGDPPA